MADNKHIEEETPNLLEHQHVQSNTENNTMTLDQARPSLDQENTALNPTVEPTRTDTDNIEEYIRKHSDIELDWYVPNLSITHVIDLIEDRLPISTEKTRYYSTAPN